MVTIERSSQKEEAGSGRGIFLPVALGVLFIGAVAVARFMLLRHRES